MRHAMPPARALAALLLLACDGPTVPLDGGAGGAVARFDPMGAPLAFGAVPFPSDLYLDSLGHPRIGELPTRLSGDPRFVALRELVGLRRGFCGTCNVYFAIDGALNAESLPSSASPSSVASIDDAIVMADVDPASPERGRLIPLRVEHDPRLGTIAVRPVRGIVLRRDRRYAVALTDAIEGSDGSPLAPSPDFLAVRDGDGFERVREILGPALDELEDLGLPRERVVSLAAFTVADPTFDLLAARAVVQASPAPVAIVDRVWSTAAELDALLGVPAEARPGIDVTPMAGTEGTRAIRHATTLAVISGRFSSPRIVTGTGTEIGVPRRDGAGALASEAQDEVPFLLIVPSGADLTRLPVVVHHHGFNASRTTGFVLADTAGRAGAAVLSIDAFQHGERAATRTDEVNAMRGGVAGADGFSETDVLDVSARVFGISGAPDDMQLFPGYPLGAFLQFATDVMTAIRLAGSGDVAAIRAALPALDALAFDPARVFYAGNSMGAVIGSGVLAVESDASAYVLNVLPGSIVDSLADGAEFRPLTEGVFLPILGVRGGFDEVERSVVFDPIVDLLRWALEPIDPYALAPYLLINPAAEGPRPDVLAQLASLDQLAAPTGAQAMLAAAGIPGIGELEIAPVEIVEAPLRANVGELTAGAIRFDPAAHGMLEILEQPSTHELPLVPPLVERSSPIVVTNPIDDVHVQIEHFLRTRIESGRAEIR